MEPGSVSYLCDERGSEGPLEECTSTLRRSDGDATSIVQAKEKIMACMLTHGWDREEIQMNY
jgi:hypothetical protein